MLNIHNALDWYTLELAAKRLSLTTNQEVTKKDILELALQGKLPLRWQFQDKKVQAAHPPIADASYYLVQAGFDEDPNLVGEVEGKERSWAEYALVKYVVNTPTITDETAQVLLFPPIDTPIETKSGNFKLELELNPMSRNWLMQWCRGGTENVIAMDGIILVDDDGTFWRVLDNNEGKFTPRLTPPNESELGLTREDLEEFEQSLTDKPEKTRSAMTKENVSLSILAYGIATLKYGFDPTKQRSSIPQTIADDLYKRYGDIGLTDDTVRKYLRLGAEHIKSKEYKEP